MNERFKINDFVIYNGNGTTLEPRRRNKDYAKIIDIKKIGGIIYFGLQLYSLDEKISCLFDQINDIKTSITYLELLGLKENKLPEGIITYSINNFFITNYLFGYCLGKIENIKVLEKYKINGNFSQDKFNGDFLNLNNVNDLFDIYEEKANLTVSRMEIISTLKLN